MNSCPSVLCPGKNLASFFDPNQETDDSEMTRCYVTMSHKARWEIPKDIIRGRSSWVRRACCLERPWESTANNAVFQKGIIDIFKTLSRWELPPLELALTASSPMDRRRSTSRVSGDPDRWIFRNIYLTLGDIDDVTLPQIIYIVSLKIPPRARAPVPSSSH